MTSWQMGAVGAVMMLTGRPRETGPAVHDPVDGLAPQHDGLEALDFVRAVAAELPAGDPVHLVGESRLDRLGPERARYHEEPGGLHVYPLLPVPEGRAARTAIIGFVQGTLDGPARH